jgi:hypothetical protein
MINHSSGFKTKTPKAPLPFLILVLMMVGSFSASAQPKMMIRIAEIEIDPAYLEAYKVILEEEAAASVKLEAGVIAIFPMYPKDNPIQVRILAAAARKYMPARQLTSNT